MNIVIVGSGEIGFYLAQSLSKENHDITLVESVAEVAMANEEQINARIIHGDGTLASVLEQAGVAKADYVLAMTRNDPANILACQIAKKLGAKASICRIHHNTHADRESYDYETAFNIDNFINPEALCALELAKSIRNPGRIAVEHFARGQIEVQQISVCSNSPVLGKDLRSLKLPSDVRVGYIHENGDVRVANADSKIVEGNEVTVFGSPSAMEPVIGLLDPDHQIRKTFYVTIFGGTETGIMLIRLLQHSRFKIKLIEKNLSICEDVADKYPKVTVIHGDGTSLKILEEEQVGDGDFFIACSRDDEDNIMTGVQAKQLGVKHTQIVINKSDYEYLLREIRQALQVEAVVSAREACVGEVTRYISQESSIELACLPGGEVKIMEMAVPGSCKFIGKRIDEIPWPRML